VANQNFKVKTGLEVGTGVTISAGIITATSFSGNATNATYAVIAGVSTYSGVSGFSTFSGYSNASGVSTFADYANNAGIATYTITAGVSTYSGVSGVSTFSGYSNISGISTYASSAGIATTTTNIPNLTGDITSNGTATSIASGVIVNDDINASAAIAVSKLSASTISGVTLGNNLSTLTLNTSGTGLSGSTTYNGSGSATFTVASNATSSNTNSTIVARDASGNFSAGAITGTSISDSSGNVRAVPQNSQTSAYILVIGDVGKHISITTGGVTINSGIFSAGDVVSIYNNSGSNQTITQGGSVTMYLAGTPTTGNRTLAQRGICTILCVASNTFVISGAGLT